MRFLLALLFAAAPLVVGTPFNAGRDSRAFCRVVDEVVTFAHKQSTATAFCSSYLKIPVVSSTSTRTRTAKTTSTVTTTYGTSTIVAPISTVTSTSIVESISTVTSTTSTTLTSGVSTTTVTSSITGCAAPAANGKRNAAFPTPSRPNVLSAYAPGKLLSSPCSCLSIPASTTVVDKCTVITSTTTSTSSYLASTTSTPLTTTTAIITVPSTTTTTTTQTSTVPSSIATATKLGPFKALASGGGIINNLYAQIQNHDAYTIFAQFSGHDVASASDFYIEGDGQLSSPGFRTASLECGGFDTLAFGYSPCGGSTSCEIVSTGMQCRLMCTSSRGDETYNAPAPDDPSGGVDGVWAVGESRPGYPGFQAFAVSA